MASPRPTRLVCDSCAGMFVTVDELTNVMHAGEDPKFIDDGASALDCPRCAQAMRACRLTVGKIELDHALGRCERDGVWFPGGALVDIFTKVGHAGHLGASSGRFAGGVGHQYVPMLQPKPKPIPPPVPTSQFKDRRLPCPICEGVALALDRWTCERCHGTFVENDSLVVMVSEMMRGPWEMPPSHGAEGKRACPVCTLAMQVEQFEAVPIDRCPEHGVWFDPAELGTALQHASGVGRRGVGAWLRRLL